MPTYLSFRTESGNGRRRHSIAAKRLCVLKGVPPVHVGTGASLALLYIIPIFSVTAFLSFCRGKCYD